MRYLCICALCVSGVIAQRYFGGVGQQTWAANDPTKCIAWFERYLAGVQREANECADDRCTCASQGRVHIVNATGSQASYTPLEPFNNASWDLFGIHTVNCSYHSFGHCPLSAIENDFQDQLGKLDAYLPLMDYNLGLWVGSLDKLLSKFEQDHVDFFPMQWISGGITYYSAIMNPCGMVLLEFISSDIGARQRSLFHGMDSRMDFDLPYNVPAPPSDSNPLQLTPLKISRATRKLDEVVDFYTKIFNASVLLRHRFEGGNEKLVLKFPDVSTGNSSVQLQFWSPATSAAASPNPAHIGCTNWTVDSWEAYLNQCAADEIVSSTCGFPKVLDFHFSFDCVDSDCVLDDVMARLESLGARYRWTKAPGANGRPWWLLYIPDPTGYGVETHYVHWKNPPNESLVAPGCFGTYQNGTCAGSRPGQCT